MFKRLTVTRKRTIAIPSIVVTTLLWSVLASAACGADHGGVRSARAGSALARGIQVGSPSAKAGLQRWLTPKLSRDVHGYVATLNRDAGGARSATAERLQVRVAGIGYPGFERMGPTTYVGPGVAVPWTQIAHGQYTVSVAHQGSWLGLKIWSRGGRWRAKVDDRYVDPRPRSVGSDYAMHTIGLEFRNAQASKRHVVQFELSGGAWLAGISAGLHDHLSLPPQSHKPSLYWLGDSYFAGGGARWPGFSDLVHRASTRIGSDDVTVDALGGTGYVQDNAAAKFDDFLTRARTNIGARRAVPDVIVIGGSINDIGYDFETVRATAKRLYAYLGRAVPSARVFIVVFAPRFPVPPNFAALNRAILSAAASSPNVTPIDLPAGLARSTSGLQGPDGHPTQAGHDAYGRAIADAIRHS
jgi:lysophospholipase L1-like esterase